MPQHTTKRLLIWLLIAFMAAAFVYNIRSILLPFVVGVLTAYFLDPAADRLERAGVRRSIATTCIIGLFFLLITLAGGLVVPMIVRQASELLAAAPGYAAALQAQYGARVETLLSQVEPGQAETLKTAAANLMGNAVRIGGAVLAGVFVSGMALVNLLSLLLITPLVAFYLLRDWDAITRRVDGLLPLAHADTIREQLLKIDETLAGFLRGQMNVCLILGVYYGALLSIAGLHFGLVIGLLSGLLVILPYVGFLFTFLIAMAVGLLQFGLTPELGLVAGVYLGGQVIESYFLTPKLVGDRVGLHPLWIIFGMLSGGALFGFVGVLLSVPVTAIIGVLIRFATERYLHSSLYYGK